MQLFSRRDQDTNSSSSTRQRHMRSSLRTVTLLIICTLLMSLSATLIFMPHQARAASWNLIWNDEFNGASGTGVNTSNWLYDTGTSYPGGAANWGTGEVETMSSSTANVYQDGASHLAIKPIRSNGNWTSGRIETQRTDFAAPAGGEMAAEASIQMPNVTGTAAQGYWPAFWMLGAAFRGNYNNWPSVGEIDAMENVNGTNREYGTLHCGVDPGGPCNETNGLGGNTPCSPTTCQAAFHTYRVEVDRSISPEEIRWYLDGVEFWHVYSNNPGMDPTTWANAVDHGFFIILDVAMGGGWPGNPTSSTQSGVPMLVDYVRVYTSSSSAPTPTPTSTPTPTPTPSGGGNASGLSINCGGPTVGSYLADTDYSGGSTASTTASIDTTRISNPAPMAVYQTERYGNITYTIGGFTANANYTVSIQEAEIYWTASGKRIFNVSINGTQVLTNFDIYASIGANTAISENFTEAASSSGTFTIQFTTVVDNAKCSGIQITAQ